MRFPEAIGVIDSHTEGEPTRVVVGGWPQPEGDTMAARLAYMRRHQDHLRKAVTCEPRGHDAMVGALLTDPVTPGAECGVVFFNNVGYLGMCGHGTIGVAATLIHLGRVVSGDVRIDTPVGTVTARCALDGKVTIRNVAAHAFRQDVSVDVPGIGTVTGDVAYGGNWFFITDYAGELSLRNVDQLLDVTRAILTALAREGITGAGGAEIDHVELSAHGDEPGVDACNFVLCPGGEYDRSPCGTGTSAKLAVLHARGLLQPGQRWTQRSITKGRFTGWLEEIDGELVPFISGSAFVVARSSLLFDPADRHRFGFTAR